MARLPWFKLFKVDWLQEPTLRLCSRAARSLWLDMLCLMHDGQPCGHLTLNGKPLDAKTLAAVLGDRPKDVAAWLKELEEAGVFSRGRRNVIVSRRMVRDAAKAELGLQSAQRRWGGRDDAPNGVGSGVDGGRGSGKPSAQSPDARSQTQDSDSSESKTKEDGDIAGVLQDGSGETATVVMAAAVVEPIKRKRPERADLHLAKHMTEHGGMDAGAAWTLIAAARDPRSGDHALAAQRCEEYSRRFRLGWFADEQSWAAPAAPALAARGGR